MTYLENNEAPANDRGYVADASHVSWKELLCRSPLRHRDTNNMVCFNFTLYASRRPEVRACAGSCRVSQGYWGGAFSTMNFDLIGPHRVRKISTSHQETAEIVLNN